MTIIISTSLIVTILSYFFYKEIHKYRYYLYAGFGIIVLLLLDEPNIVSLGYIPFGTFLVVMYAGVLEKSTIRKRLFMVRAELAVIGGILLIPHAFGFIEFLLDDYKGPLMIFFLFGILSVIILIPLWITSFTFVRKKMGYKNWKRLHQIAYVFYGSVLFHLILMKNERMWIYILILSVYVLLKSPEWVKVIKKKR